MRTSLEAGKGIATELDEEERAMVLKSLIRCLPLKNLKSCLIKIGLRFRA
jgi:hypothetical protein